MTAAAANPSAAASSRILLSSIFLSSPEHVLLHCCQNLFETSWSVFENCFLRDMRHSLWE